MHLRVRCFHQRNVTTTVIDVIDALEPRWKGKNGRVEGRRKRHCPLDPWTSQQDWRGKERTIKLHG